MILDLPQDVLSVVAVHATLRDTDRLLGCCRTLRDVGEDVYHDFAVHRHGHAFWTRARSRRTQQTFGTMREQLRRIEEFECALRRRALPLWTTADYFAYWMAEETYLERASSAEGDSSTSARVPQASGV